MYSHNIKNRISNPTYTLYCIEYKDMNIRKVSDINECSNFVYPNPRLSHILTLIEDDVLSTIDDEYKRNLSNIHLCLKLVDQVNQTKSN